jgi:hypothetical protein
MIARFGLLCIVAAAGCASSGQSARTGSNESSGWSGSFRQRPIHTTAEFGPAVPNRGTGTVSVVPVPGETDRMRIDLTINVGVPPSNQIAWAVYSGTCGSAGLIVANQTAFPPLDVSSAGDAHFRGELALNMDRVSSYHVNIYATARANDLNDVMMCADLRSGA